MGRMVRGWQGGPRGRGYMHTCGRFTLLYSRNQHSTVKQLQTNLKKRWGKFFFIASLRDNTHSSLPSISLHPQMQALLTSEGWRRREHLKCQGFPILLHFSLQHPSFPFLVRTREITDILISSLYHHANLENSAVAAGLEKVSFHSKPKE